MNPRAPRAISELIVNALPELRERLVEEGIRRSWPAVVGAEGARRSRPQRLTNRLLEVAVDNSPWLHELTLRAPDLTTRLRAQFAAITSLRFVLPPVGLPAAGGGPEVRPYRAVRARAGPFPEGRATPPRRGRDPSDAGRAPARPEAVWRGRGPARNSQHAEPDGRGAVPDAGSLLRRA